MMVALGENGIKTVEDFADCATDELVGWTERKKEKDTEPVKHKGILDGFELSRTDVENMIMAARVHAGWIKAEDLEKPAEVEGEPEAASEDAGPQG
jgi:N utilization substance protein A